MSAYPNIVFFVGAGFSKSFQSALPTAEELLYRILSALKRDPPHKRFMVRNAIRDIIPHVQPRQFGFEYLLGVLENLRSNPTDAHLILGATNPDDVWHCILAKLAKIVRYKDRAYEDAGRPSGLQAYENFRRQKHMGALIRVLEHCKTHCQSVSIITTNYDLICDKAASIIHDQMHGYDDIGTAIMDLRRAQHGVKIRGTWTMKHGRSVLLKNLCEWEEINGIPVLKLHGSLNFSYCSNCPGLDLALTKEDLPYIIDNDLRVACPKCGEGYEWVFVPPLPNKGIAQQPVLNEVWDQAESCLAQAQRVIFIGYSLPPSDPLVIQMILKARAKSRRNHGTLWQYMLFDKNNDVCERYCGLFGTPENTFVPEGFNMARFEKEKLGDICS